MRFLSKIALLFLSVVTFVNGCANQGQQVQDINQNWFNLNDLSGVKFLESRQNDKLDYTSVLFHSSTEHSKIGCGFQLVRRVKPGRNWHPVDDGLTGTAVYGEFIDDHRVDRTFSRFWNNSEVDEFLFANGDFSEWMRMSKLSVGGKSVPAGEDGEFYENNLRRIIASSRSVDTYGAIMYNRDYCCREDPWLSANNHVAGSDENVMLYGENSDGHYTKYIRSTGANVFVRNTRAC